MFRLRHAPVLPLLLLAVVGLAGAASASSTGTPATVAYIDPGVGSFLLQALVATLAGAAVAVHSRWQRIKAYFARSRGAASEEPPRDPAAADD